MALLGIKHIEMQTHVNELSVGGNSITLNIAMDLRSRKKVCICKLHDPGKIIIS